MPAFIILNYFNTFISLRRTPFVTKKLFDSFGFRWTTNNQYWIFLITPSQNNKAFPTQWLAQMPSNACQSPKPVFLMEAL